MFSFHKNITDLFVDYLAFCSIPPSTNNPPLALTLSATPHVMSREELAR